MRFDVTVMNARGPVLSLGSADARPKNDRNGGQ